MSSLRAPQQHCCQYFRWNLRASPLISNSPSNLFILSIEATNHVPEVPLDPAPEIDGNGASVAEIVALGRVVAVPVATEVVRSDRIEESSVGLTSVVVCCGTAEETGGAEDGDEGGEAAEETGACQIHAGGG